MDSWGVVVIVSLSLGSEWNCRLKGRLLANQFTKLVSRIDFVHCSPIPFMSSSEWQKRPGELTCRETSDHSILEGFPTVHVYAMAEDHERFSEAGMNDYIAKPGQIAELKKALDRAAEEFWKDEVQ